MIRTTLTRIRKWLTQLVEGVISSEDERKIAAWQNDRRREQADRTFAPPTASHLEPSAADLDAIRADGVADDDQPVEHTPRSQRVDPDNQTEPPKTDTMLPPARHARPDDIEHLATAVFLDWLMIEHRCGISLLRAQLVRMRAEAFL